MLIDEQLLEQGDGLLRALHAVGLLLRLLLDLLVDFVVVASREGLVPEEVDLLVLGEKLQAITLVPADGEHVEGDLPSDGVGQSDIWELLAQGLDKLLADVVHLHSDCTLHGRTSRSHRVPTASSFCRWD